jgi:hypothetical protein
MSKTGLFPLYLTPLERFFYIDDRPSHPMAFVVALDFTGVVDRAAFEAALVDALRRHPLLQAFIRPVKRGLPCWVRAKDVLPSVDWGDLSKPIALPHGERIDLSTEVGLRIWIRQGPERAVATFEFHHSATDGIGAYRFLGDLMAYYGQRVPNEAETPRLDPLEPERLRDRINLQVEYWRTNRYWAMAKRTLGMLGSLVRRRPAPLTSPEPGPKRPPAFPGIHSTSISREEFETIRSSALGTGAVLNDLLIAALFGALREWTQASGDRSARRPLRIMMPTDLRDEQSMTLPAASLTSYSFLTRNHAQCVDPTKLLADVALETIAIKNERHGMQFTDAVAVGFTSRAMGLVVHSPICLASAVLSNIGDPTRRFAAKLPRKDGRVVAGNLLLDDITGVPPLRPHTRATFSVFAYRRKLTISLRCDEKYFSDEDTMRLLEMYAKHLRGFAPAAAPEAAPQAAAADG